MKEKLSIYMYFELQRTPFGLGRVKERKEKFSSVFFYLHFVFITFESQDLQVTMAFLCGIKRREERR